MLNWFRRLLLRLTRRAVPALDRVLLTAGGTVERLDEQIRFYREQVSDQRQERIDEGAAYAAELDEAIALHQDPWLSAPVRTAEAASPATRELTAVRESLPARLKETIYGMAELEIALDDRGWKRMVAYGTYEFSRYGIQSIMLITRLYRIKSPLIGRGISISSYYPFSGGMDVSSPDKDANDAIQEFMADPRNASQLSHSAFVKHEECCWTDGNLFWAYFTDAETGSVIERGIDALEICDIMTDPSDATVPWYYHRQWTEMDVDLTTGRRSTVPRDEWYAAINWEEIENFPKFDKIEGQPVAKDKTGFPIPVLHAKGGITLPGSKFGIPKAYPALDWTRAYSEFLQNLCTTWKQLSRITSHIVAKGGAPSIAALKQTLATTFMNDLNSVEYNPPPVTGSALITGEGTKVNQMKASGITVSPEDSSRVLGMVCAAFGLPEHFFGLIDCYSADTEVLTEHGFMLHQDWQPGIKIACFNPESEAIEYHHPAKLNAQEYVGEMVSFRNKYNDILVTPNHRMWCAANVNLRNKLSAARIAKRALSTKVGWKVKNRKPKVNRDWRIVSAAEIAASTRTWGWKFKSKIRLPETGQRNTVETPFGERDAVEWARFLGYWIAEGSATGGIYRSGTTRADGTPGMRQFRRVTISQNPGPVLDSMRANLEALQIPYHHASQVVKVVVLCITQKLLWEYLRAECGQNSHTKHIPAWVLGASEPVRRAMYESLMAGDGGRNGDTNSWRYSTVSKRLADDMQLLAMSLGYYSAINREVGLYRGEPYTIWRVSASVRLPGFSVVRPDEIRCEPYAGMIYCFTLPYGLYVTRRNGKIAVQGNSGNLATASTLDRTTELMFKERQEFWREIVQIKCRFVLKQSLRKPKGKLREAMAARQKISTSEFNPNSVLVEMHPIKKRVGMQMVTIHEAVKAKPKGIVDAITIVCAFPEIVQGDLPARVGAIVKAITLDGYAPIGIDEKVGIEMLLTELGYEDAHEVVEEMYGDDYVRDRTIEPDPIEPPVDTQPTNGLPAPPTGAPAPGKSGNPDKAAPEKRDKLTAREVAALRALAAMRRVIKLHEART